MFDNVTIPLVDLDAAIEALEPFAHYYELNDCDKREFDDALEVPIVDLAFARSSLAKLKGHRNAS